MSDNNKKNDKFEFQANGGFNIGTGAPSEDNKIVSGIEALSLEKEPDSAVPHLEGNEENMITNLPPVIIKRVTAIRRMHVTIEEIDEEYRQERLALEKKYLAKKQVILDERNKIVKGEIEAQSSPDDPDFISQPVDNDKEIKGIPGFWLTCLSSHHTIGELIEDEDIPALEALNNITVDYADDFTAFTLTFHFDENEYFTNKELIKHYVISPDLLDDKAPALSDSKGTEINWKNNKNLCVTEIKKKQKAKSGRNKGQVRTIVTTQPKKSFFNYFSNPMTEEEEEEFEENGEDEDPIRLNMEEDYDVGHAIRTSIIPEAVLWYTGEAIDDEGDEEDDEEEEDDEDEDNDDDDDEDDDDEDDIEQPPKGKGNKKSGRNNNNAGGMTFTPEGGFAAPNQQGAGGDQPECKQN